MPVTFGGRLRERREQQQVPLSAIAEETKISVALLEGLERDDVSRWPGGIFRRAFVRAYADAIGLNPDLILREFLELHPDPIETAAVICDTLDHSPPADVPFSGFWRALGTSLRAVARSRSVADVPEKVDSPLDVPGTAVVPPVAPDTPLVPDPVVTPAAPPPAVIAAAPPAPEHEINWVEAAGVCTQLSQVQGADDATPLLAKASHLLGAGGIILWTWEPQLDALRPALAHGYSPKIVAQLPLVRRDDDNATAAAFHSGRTCIVSGSDRSSGGMAVPLLGPAGCLGVLALELHEGGEHSESVRAFATIMAAQLAGRVDAAPAVNVTALRRA